MASLFENPSAIRVLWHDLLKVPTAEQAFHENLEDGVYGTPSPELAHALETLHQTILEQQLLLHLTQAHNKIASGLSFGDPELVHLQDHGPRILSRFQPLITAQDRTITTSFSTEPTSYLCPALLESLLTLFVGFLCYAPHLKQAHLSTSVTEQRLTIVLTSSDPLSLSTKLLETPLENLFTTSPNEWSQALRFISVLNNFATTQRTEINLTQEPFTLSLTI